MEVTHNWLKEFVDARLSPRRLADRLTMAGLEVTSFAERAGDVVFEIEVTSNRPDWLSIAGVAREIAALTGRRLTLPPAYARPRLRAAGPRERFVLKIADRQDCSLYQATIIRGVRVGPSPAWLKERLELLGCRSVNNVVDITNYVLFEWGQPLHAFDLAKLATDTIVVRRAREGERIVTIDGQERILDRGILVIADKVRPVAVAGVMGGVDTEVTESTRDILLEAAVFGPVVIRRGRRALGIQTESSYRFERSVDACATQKNSAYASRLITSIVGGTVTLIKAAPSSFRPPPQTSLVLNAQAVGTMLGADMTAGRIKPLLLRLGFRVKAGSGGRLLVKAPSWRPDVRQQVDLVEEVARIVGYDRIPATLPAIKPQARRDTARETIGLMKQILIGLSVTEVITYSLIDKKMLGGFVPEDAALVELASPLSSEQAVLRPVLVPSLLKVIASNLNQKQDYVHIFEVAKVFRPGPAGPEEKLALGIALSGTRSLLLDQGLVRDDSGPLHVKGILETVFRRLGVEEYSFRPGAGPDTLQILIGTEQAGTLREFPAAALAGFDIKHKAVSAAEVYLDPLLRQAHPRRCFVKLPLYPGITRDISLVVKQGVPCAEILAALRQEGIRLLRQVQIADHYTGKQIPAGYQGLTISCLYRSDERTLTEEEINPLHAAACQLLAGRFDAKIR